MDEGFLSISNNFFKNGHPQQLNVEELYLYAYLHMRRNFDTQSAITNISLIEGEIEFVKKKQVNKERIIKALESLKLKGLISYEDAVKEQVLNIELTIYHDANDGFEMIPYSYFKKVNTPVEFAIMCYIKKIEKIRNKIPFIEFSGVLLNDKNKKITMKTVENIINTMENKKLITIQSGGYNLIQKDSPKRFPNKYEVKEDKQKTPAEQLTETKKLKKIDSLIEKSTETREHNMFDGSVKLTVNDMVIFLTTDCNILKTEGQKRLDSICKSEGGRKLINYLKDKAKEEIEEIKRKKHHQLMREAEKEQRDETREFHEQKIVYKKRERKDDISAFLDDINKYQVNEDLDDDDLDDLPF